MLDALYFYFSGVSQALAILLNLEIPLTDESSIKMYWILFLLFALLMFIKVAYQYLKGGENGSNH